MRFTPYLIYLSFTIVTTVFLSVSSVSYSDTGEIKGAIEGIQTSFVACKNKTQGETGYIVNGSNSFDCGVDSGVTTNVGDDFLVTVRGAITKKSSQVNSKGYPVVLSSTHYGLCEGCICYGRVPKSDSESTSNCGYDLLTYVTNSFGRNSVVYGSKNAKVSAASSTGNLDARWGDSYAYFFKNKLGVDYPLDLTIGACGDVIIYMVKGEITAGLLGTSVTQLYHRNEDSTKIKCACDDNINLSPVIKVPTENFRLVFLVRGQDCFNYIGIPARNSSNWIESNHLEVDYEGIDNFLK